MAEFETHSPISVEPIPPHVARSIGRLLQRNLEPLRPEIEKGLAEIEEAIAPDDQVGRAYIEKAKAGEASLYQFLGDLANADAVEVDVYNDQLLKLVFQPGENETFIPDGTDESIEGEPLKYLVNVISHEINTRLQPVKGVQVPARKTLPEAGKTITQAVNSFSDSLDVFDGAAKLRVVGQHRQGVSEVQILLYPPELSEVTP